MDALVSELIKGLVDALTKPSLINLDFADLRTIIKHGGISTLLYAENADPEGVVQDAIQNPLLDVDIKGGTGALIHISGGSKLTLRRVHRIVEGLTKELDVDANVKFGVRTVEDDNETIRLIALVTGISELVRGKEARFLTEIDRDIKPLHPEDTERVPVASPRFANSRLYLESLLRQAPQACGGIGPHGFDGPEGHGHVMGVVVEGSRPSVFVVSND